MSKSPDRPKLETPQKLNKPKRREQKSLPLIQNRQVPLHQIASKKKHADELKKQMQPQFWAYVPSKSTEHKQSSSTLSVPEVTLDMSRSNMSNDPSLTLLDKYFQRKHQTKLKSVVRFIEDASDYAPESIGFDQIRIFENIVKKKQSLLAMLSQTKRDRCRKTDALIVQTSFRNKKTSRSVFPKSKFHSFIEGYKNSEIDNYFLEEKPK